MRYLPRLIPLCLAFIFITFSFTLNNPVAAGNPMILPAGFVDEPVYGGLLAPRAFTFTPDGRVLALERGSATSDDFNFGSVRVYKNGALLPTRALTLNTCGDAERGALGIAVDPNFAGNGYVYIYYTRQDTTPPDPACGYNTFTNGNTNGPRNRISRFTMSGDIIDPNSEKILIESIITDIGYHNAGDLHFGLDGYLYASVGEGGLSWTSQDTGTLNGKILRIHPTPGAAGGYTTTGNPYDSAAGARNCATPDTIYLPPSQGGTTSSPGPCKEIFASGFRNPFRFSIEPNMAGIPGAGSPMVGDVGGGVWEEINQVHSGGNYGYPAREGYCSSGVLCSPPYVPVAPYDNPLYAYPHAMVNANFDSAVIGGDFYIGGAGYPAAYVNNYFFTDFARRFIGRLVYSGGQWVRTAQDFGSNGTGPIGLKRGPDGNLYYLTFVPDAGRTDGIRRIRYTGATNQRPTAQISVDKQSGPVSTTTYNFDASASTDPENNTPFTYNWDFGDGNTATTSVPTTSHQYTDPTPQNYVTTLTVTDSGSPPATSLPVTIIIYAGNTPPSGTISLSDETNPSFSSSFIYYAGDVWDYSANNLSSDVVSVSWDIVFHHEQHTHPFIPFVPGNSGQFTIPNTGELDPVVFYRVHMFITDDRGQQTEVTQDIHPVTKALKFMTSPSSGKVTIEGATFPTPLNITRVVGMKFTVTVPSPQTIWGLSTVFNSWSQGGNRQQLITVPPADTTYTANFTMPGNAIPIRNDFTTHNPTLTWNKVTWATHYVVQVANNTAFTGGVAYQAGNNLSLTLPTTNDGLYYWRVAACSTATTCTWSAADTFVIDAS